MRRAHMAAGTPVPFGTRSLGEFPAHSDASTGGNGTPPAEIGEGDVLADPLPMRLAAWLELTDADRLAVVEMAERLPASNRDGVKVDG